MKTLIKFMSFLIDSLFIAIHDLRGGKQFGRIVTPDNNHLFGHRRYYSAQIATGRTLLEIIREHDGLLNRIKQLHNHHEHVLVLAAIVDDEIRVNIYGIVYDAYCNHYVGLDDPQTSGVSSFVFSRAGEPGSKQMTVQHILLPDRARKYNQYEAQVSWTLPLADLDECVLHRDSFKAQQV